MIKIIAADDEQYIRNALSSLVDWSDLGAQLVGVYSNGRELIEAVDKDSPDIVITDIRMPVMDGIEVCKTLQEKYPQIGIIVLSAYSDFSYARMAMKYGVIEYILKADVVEELPVIMERIIKEREKSTEETIAGNDEQNLFLRMQEYVNLHYREEISLTSLAEILHANASYLSRLYKSGAGVNLSDDILKKRIDKAKECLLTGMKIYDIAEYVGFNDVGYFSKTFKKYTGKSPKDYRQERM
ncbi:MAG: response regulator [Lachnospiraceae bacterium]|nr:response regulator [Lachnospiraceae bacterium]